MSAAIRRFLGEFLVVGAGKIVSLGALFACTLVVARFSGPEELGRFAAAFTIVLLLDVALGGALDFAAVRFSALHRNDPPRVARFHGATFRIKAVLVIGLLGIAALARAPLGSALFDDPDSGALVLWCLGATASLVVLRSTLAWLQSAARFRAYAAVDALNGLLRVGAMVAVGLAGMRSAEAFLAVLAVAIAGTYIASVFVIRQPYLTAPRASREDTRAILGFIGATAGILILGTFTGRSDVFFVKRMVSAEAAGLYAAAAQVASVITMIASYACVILQPRLLHAGKGAIRRLALVSVGLGAVAAIVLLPAAHIGGAWGMALMFGGPFAASAGVLVVVLIGTCLDLIFMPVLMTLSLQTRAKASLMGEVVITAVFIGLIVGLGDRGAMTIAWIATGVRGLKLVLYAWLALTAPVVQATSNAGRSD